MFEGHHNEKRNRLKPEPRRLISRAWSGFFVLLGFVAVVRAAPSLTATLDREIVPVGENVTLTLTFEDAAPQGSPNLPALPNLALQSVGHMESQLFVQGRRTVKYAYTYNLRATAVGDVTIPAIHVLAGGQLLNSQPVKLKVVQGPAPDTTPAPQTAFLKMLIPKSEVYLGEPLPVEVTLYVQEAREPHVPQLAGEGFTVGKMIQAQQSRTQVNGQVYSLVPFRTYVAPARAGQLQLGPATMAITIPKPNARRSIFGVVESDWQRTTLTADAQTVNVLPLPDANVPPNFSGAVGSYSLQVTAGPTNLAVGDPITIKVQISGRGLLEALALPDQPQWRDFTAYPPSSRIDSGEPHSLSGIKTFEQVLIPQNHEIKVLPAFQFSFFDPQQKAYRTLRGAAIPLTIRPTASAAPPPAVTNAANQKPQPADDIIHIKTRSKALAVAKPPLAQTPWFLGLQAVPMLAWVSVAVMRRRREALANNPRLRRQREVNQRIQQGLRDLQSLASGQQAEEFFALLFRLLQEQLGERLNVPASSITEAVLEQPLIRDNLSPDTWQALSELFHVCNQARYAPYRTAQELESLIPQAKHVLIEIQKLKV